jgi:phage gp45-like
MIRGTVKRVTQGPIQRVSAKVWGDGSVDNRELIQHYGYTSRPAEGAEVIFIREGGQFIAIGSDDRRYRITLEEGEVALYDDLGQKVQLTRTGIVLESTLQVTIKSPQIVQDGHVTATRHVQTASGRSGTFFASGKTVTVRNGLIVGGLE